MLKLSSLIYIVSEKLALLTKLAFKVGNVVGSTFTQNTSRRSYIGLTNFHVTITAKMFTPIPYKRL